MALAANALTDVAALSAFLNETVEAGDPTTFAERLINGYSQAIERYTQREFKPKAPANDADQPVARRFRYDGSGLLDLSDPISDLRSLGGAGFGGTGTITMFSDRPDAYHYSPQAGTTTTEGLYRLEPRGRTAEGTYLWLELPVIEREPEPFRRRIIDVDTTISDATVFTTPNRLGDEVTISGYWGIGSVPADVELACLMCCEMEWRRTGERAEGQTLSEADPDALAPRGAFWLPYEARSLLEGVKRSRPRRLLV